jgi:hypothetical protein
VHSYTLRSHRPLPREERIQQRIGEPSWGCSGRDDCSKLLRLARDRAGETLVAGYAVMILFKEDAEADGQIEQFGIGLR